MSNVPDIVYSIVAVALVVISIAFHEAAHAYAAFYLGDSTAKDAGRLTLNPIAHLDPFGSVLLPLVLTLAGGPGIGYAKPVPYNPRNLKNPRRDEVLVALAGPAANLAQAIVGAILLNVFLNFVADPLLGRGAPIEVLRFVYFIFYEYTYVNVMLMFFNLIPLPPLDGSKILFLFLKGEARMAYYKIQRYAMPILLVVLYVLPRYLGIDIVGAFFSVTAEPLFRLLTGA